MLPLKPPSKSLFSCWVNCAEFGVGQYLEFLNPKPAAINMSSPVITIQAIFLNLGRLLIDLLLAVLLLLVFSLIVMMSNLPKFLHRLAVLNLLDVLIAAVA